MILINNVLINVLIMNSDIQEYSLKTIKTGLSELLKEIQNQDEVFIVQQKLLRVNDLNVKVYQTDKDKYTDRKTVNLMIKKDEYNS